MAKFVYEVEIFELERGVKLLIDIVLEGNKAFDQAAELALTTEQTQTPGRTFAVRGIRLNREANTDPDANKRSFLNFFKTK